MKSPPQADRSGGGAPDRWRSGPGERQEDDRWGRERGAARGGAGQAGTGRGAGERSGERRPDPPPAPRPSVRAGPLNAAGPEVGVACKLFPPPGDASPGLSPQCHPGPAPPAPRIPPGAAGPRVPANPHLPLPRPAGGGAAAVTCAGGRQARRLLRRGDSQMVRQGELPPRPLRPAPRAPRRLPASP
ncbi:hypothetical protein LEMLEM_LOCUS10240 [Lemmus lemmus]